jgi:Zn-dependent peptidase ImmA (M78 family)
MKKESMEIKIPSPVLRMLRESSGYSIDQIAKKLKTSEERIRAVEEGAASFTLNQIKKLADVYHRPLAAFFETSPPELKYTLSDYRINREKKLPSEVHLAERRAYYLAKKIAELSGKKSQIPTFPDGLKGEELANEFRKYLNVDHARFEKPENILAFYKKALEEKLIISIIEYPVKADDVRAFCISSDICAVVLNEKDDTRIKQFSLFHEVCHLLKRNSAICSIDVEAETKNQEAERYCDLFAAEFLVPKDSLKVQVENLGVLNWDAISELSNLYGVSKQVIMLRLLRLDKISIEGYRKFKDSLNVEKLKKKGFGRRSWDKVFHNRAGNLAIQEIRTAYHKGDIPFSEAINVLNMKTKYVEKLIT